MRKFVALRLNSSARMHGLNEVTPAGSGDHGGEQPFINVRVRGQRALIAGHGPLNADGSLAGQLGKVPSDVSLEQAYETARLVGLATFWRVTATRSRLKSHVPMASAPSLNVDGAGGDAELQPVLGLAVHRARRHVPTPERPGSPEDFHGDVLTRFEHLYAAYEAVDDLP